MRKGSREKSEGDQPEKMGSDAADARKAKPELSVVPKESAEKRRAAKLMRATATGARRARR
ncbi:MAG: hypothetical protein R3F11_00990 [Verrucomicrobiales bacterium]